MNEVRFGYSHYYQLFLGTDSTQDPANYNFNGQVYEFPTGINPAGPGGISYGGAPDIRLQGFNAFPSNAIGVGWPKQVGPDGVTELLDHVSILKGKHSFKFGGEFIENQSHTDETANAKGQLRFSNLTNFFEGNLKQGALFLGDAAVNLYNYGYAAFLQDDWRITPRLTLNLGVRYELNTVVHEKDGLMGNFDPIRGLVQTNNPYNGDHNNFSPRVGFAYDLFGNGKTVLRGGAGILYEQLSFDVMNGEGNFLGLRAFPTGLPAFNDGNPVAGPPRRQHPTAIALLSTAQPDPWPDGDSGMAKFQSPALPIALLDEHYSPVCCDSSGLRRRCYNFPRRLLQRAPPPCEVYGVDPNLRTPYVESWNLGHSARHHQQPFA